MKQKIGAWMFYIVLGIAGASLLFMAISLLRGDMTAAGVWAIAFLLAITFG